MPVERWLLVERWLVLECLRMCEPLWLGEDGGKRVMVFGRSFPVIDDLRKTYKKKRGVEI